jgi:peptide/nickel transport system ATP-binding protein
MSATPPEPKTPQVTGPPVSENALEVKDLKTYIALRHGEVRAVDGVTFNVKRGETLGIVGESGCGKTMTGMSIMRLLPSGGYIAGGSIISGGVDLVTASTEDVRRIRARHIGMIFQDPMTSLNPTMSIGRQISEPVQLHLGLSKSASMERAAEVLDLVGMPRPRERLADYPHQLSGGLRQRVMIAMALACEPELIIADEPTTALDVTIQAQILSLLDDLRSRLGMAMILITHDMGVIASHTDRVMVMYAGKVVETATTYDLFGEMKHPYTEALLASIPQLDQDTTQRLYSIPGLPPDLSKRQTGCRFAPRCLYATDECRQEEPPLEGTDPSHLFACFHPRSTSAEDVAGAGDLLVAAARLGGLANAAAARSSEEPAPIAEAAALLAEPALGPDEAEMNEDIILELRDVSKDFAVTSGVLLQRKVGFLSAVSDVSLGIRRGETFGLVGESGCGKTTLGRMMVALEPPTRGQVIFNDTDLAELKRSKLRSFRRDLQMMFQDPQASLDPRMRVGSTIREPLVIQGIGDRKSQDAKVADLLNEVGLPTNAVSRYPHEFSGGQRQRVGLARALALNPKLIVADEPVSALDVSIRSQILNLMKDLQRDHELTYVFISHDLSVVRYLADRIGVMYLGKLVEVGTGDDIYARTAHPYTAGLLESIPIPRPVEGSVRPEAAMKGELPSPINPPSGCRFRTRCPLAQERCAVDVPELVSFGGEHLAACHFPLQQPVTITSGGRGFERPIATREA